MQWLRLQECTRRATPVRLWERGRLRRGSRRSGSCRSGQELRTARRVRGCVSAFQVKAFPCSGTTRFGLWILRRRWFALCWWLGYVSIRGVARWDLCCWIEPLSPSALYVWLLKYVAALPSFELLSPISGGNASYPFAFSGCWLAGLGLISTKSICALEEEAGNAKHSGKSL